MSIAADSLWDLAVEARLLSGEECTKLRSEFASQGGANSATAEEVSQWLISKGAISRYQANILLAGQPGPFVYGDYRIYERIESGRLAGIFRAIHLPTKHRVCLMFLTGEATQDPAVVARLAQQAAIVNRISQGYPNLLRCYHLADVGTYKFLVVEDLLGRRVERLLSKHGALKPHEACRIARQAAMGLVRLHALGLVHSDVRPANLWMDAAGPIKLIQFPLIRDPLEPEFSLSRAKPDKHGRAPVELEYLAPEVAQGQPADARSDIYALGCTLYQMLTNQVPFPGGDIKQKLKRIVSDTPQPVQELNPSVSPELAKLLGYLMHKNPDLRFQQASSVVERLLPHLSPEDAQLTPPSPTKGSVRYDAWLQAFYKQSGIVLPPLGKPAQGTAAATPATPAAKPASATPTPAAASPVAATPAATAAPAVAAPAAAQPGAPAVASVATPAAVSVTPAGVPVQPAAVAAPVMAQPGAVAAPVMAQPAVAQPVAAQPYVAAPATAQPVMAAGTFPAATPAVPQFGVPTAGGSTASQVALQARARRRRQAVQTTLIALMMVVVAAGGITWYLLYGSALLSNQVGPGGGSTTTTSTETPVASLPPENAPAVTEKPAPPPPAAESPSDQGLKGLDGPLWRSPTAGKPIDIRFLPPGVHAVIALRPADILAHPLGSRLLDPEKMGELAGWIPGTLPQLAGVPAEQIESVVIGLLPDMGSGAKLALVARTTEVVERSVLLNRLGNAQPQTAGEKEYLVAGDRAYYLPPGAEGRMVVMAPVADMSLVLESDGSMPPPIAQPIEFLLTTSDDQRMLTFVFVPKVLSTSNQELLYGVGLRFREPLNWFLTGVDTSAPSSGGMTMTPQDLEPPRAVLASAHLGDNLFAELRAFDPTVSPNSPGLAQALRERMAAVPRGVDRYSRRLLISPHSENLLFEFGDYLSLAEKFVRAGTVDKQAILRLSLPAESAEWIWLGGYLCLVETPRDGAAIAMATPGATAAPSAPATAADKLKKKIDLSFQSNTLEVSMQLIADEIGAPIVILGSDLQLEGITKNQSFGIDERGKSASEIMQIIFQRANPDGKLVYVIKPDESGQETIFVTTRTAVERRGDTLPPEFAQPK